MAKLLETFRSLGTVGRKPLSYKKKLLRYNSSDPSRKKEGKET
jgi:hypothetical protein